MSINDYVNDSQRQAIYNLIKELEIKKAASIHKDIYDNHKGDYEFWQGLANNVTNKLLNSGYSDGFELNNRGHYVELCDNSNKEKYQIYKNGNVEGPIEYTPTRGLDLDGFQIFLIVMAFVYLILFFISVSVSSVTLFLVTIALGIINIFVFFSS